MSYLPMIYQCFIELASLIFRMPPLVSQPDGGSQAAFGAVHPVHQIQRGRDSIHILLQHPRTGLVRTSEKSIHQELTLGSQKPLQVLDIGLLVSFIKAVVATDVEDQVKLASQIVWVKDVPNPQVYVYTCLAGLAPGDLNGPPGKVNPGHLPAVTGERDCVCAGTAAEIQGATRRMVGDEVHQLGRTDAGIPGWIPEVLELEA